MRPRPVRRTLSDPRRLPRRWRRRTAGGGLMSPRLLVVDDDAALNLALCAHCEDRGWQATGVYDCAAALAATAGTTFEVVLLDVQLPDGDGVELLGRLLERDPHLPVILMTGGRDVERAMQGHRRRRLRLAAQAVRTRRAGAVGRPRPGRPPGDRRWGCRNR
ncbi:MAG: response regulator [Candidatus Contendobacter sp.]|nr:MAG: response regulator [Candidatus Contendobacter sp.]